MKLLTFSREFGGEVRVGGFDGDRVVDLGRAYRDLYAAEAPDWFRAMDKLLMGDEHALDLVRRVLDDATKLRGRDGHLDYAHDPNEIVYYPPVPNPGKILCVGVNYRAHTPEAGATPPEEPFVFLKVASTLIGHGWPIIVSKTSNQADNEIELAVVIGRAGKYIEKSAAYDYVAGYTIFNDVSFRDRRLHKSPRYPINWLHLKNLDTAAPTGPWIVTKDEIPEPHDLTLRFQVNDRTLQEGSTADMVHNIPDLIEYISNGITLRPGDIIATGTPFRVASSAEEYLKEGDVVRAEVEKIGTLVNSVKKEREQLLQLS